MLHQIKMINSKSLDDLLPEVAEKAREFIRIAEEELPIDELRVTSTFRDYEYQTFLYAQGRTRPGSIVTNAKAGQSWHNFQVALDVVPMINGKAVWDNAPLWKDIGEIGQECGLEWGGAWKRFIDKPHFQDTGGLDLAQLREQKDNQ